MDNTKITAVDLQTEFNAADEKTDLKALAQKAISVLAEAEAENAALQAKLDAAPANSDLQPALDEALATIAELGTKLDLQEKTKGQQGKLVTVGGKPKMLIGGRFTIKLKGEVAFKAYTADQVASDQNLLDHLDRIGSGSLVEPVTDGSTSTNATS